MHTVLVADDSSELRTMVSQCLQHWGLCVTSVGSGKEALELLRVEYFDLIVTDILMPDADGIEVLGDVRQRYRTTRIIAMSGDGARLDQKFCLHLAKRMGAHETLEKPFTVAQLEDAVRKAAPHLFLERV